MWLERFLVEDFGSAPGLVSHRLVEDKMIWSKTLCKPSTDKACSGELDSQSLRMAQHAARDSFAARRRHMLCT